MPPPGEDDAGHHDAHQHVEVAGDGRAYVAGRDQHVHLGAGPVVRRAGAADVECPYPGLAAFGPEDAKWYFGRDRLVAELLERLAERVRRPGLQLVVAASGAGKSSLLRAGLTHAVARGDVPVRGSTSWPQLIMTPTAEPLNALAAKLATLDGPGPGRGLVLIVDQFEELFTLCEDRRERAAFVETLAALAAGESGHAGQALVVLGLRADFYAHCTAYPQLRTAASEGPVVVGPMSEAELRQAIVLPAQAVGLELEPGLVELLLHDLGTEDEGPAGEVGRLPLLAHALQATWQRRHGHLLTVDGYRDTGGIHRALAKTAERTFLSLDDAGRETARALFLRLVLVGDDADPTRRRVGRDDLIAGYADLAAAVVTAFTEARLLTAGNDAGERSGDMIAITHEALLRGWPRLREWIETERSSNLVNRQLEEAAELWRRNDRDPAFLHQGSRLAAARVWAEDPANRHAVRPEVAAFLGAARALERRRRRRLYQLVAALTALLLATTGALQYARQQRSETLRQRNAAVSRLLASQAPQLYATDPALANQLAAAAFHLSPTAQAAGAVLDLANRPYAAVLKVPLRGPDDLFLGARLNFDGTVLSTTSTGGPARLWSTRTLTPVGEALPGVTVVRFHPRTNVMATVGPGQPVRLWAIADSAATQVLSALPGGGLPRGVVFDPSGDLLAVADQAGTVQLWNVRDLRHPVKVGGPLFSGGGDAGQAPGVVFSPDGRVLAVSREGEDAVVTLWKMERPDRPPVRAGTLTGPTVTMGARTFAPDSRTLATVGYGGAGVQLWAVSDPARPLALPTPITRAGHVDTMIFEPHDHVLITAAHGGLGDGGGFIQPWDVSDPARPVPLLPAIPAHLEPIRELSLSSDGRTLASSGDDDTVRVWTMDSLTYPIALTRPGDRPKRVTWPAFGPGGGVLSAATDAGIAVWDMGDLPRLPMSAPLTSGGNALPAYASDGRTMAFSTAGNGVELWDISTPLSPRRLTAVPGPYPQPPLLNADASLLACLSAGGVELWHVAGPGHPTRAGRVTGRFQRMAMDPRRARIAVVDDDGRVRVWDVIHPANPVSPDPGFLVGVIRDMQFSPDGRTLAISTYRNEVQLWDVTDSAHPAAIGAPLTGATDEVTAMAFSPDSTTLAMGSRDASIRLWDLADRTPGRQPRGTFTADGAVEALMFRGEGRELLSVSDDFSGTVTVRSWRTDVDQAARHICDLAGSHITPAQWRQYLPEVDYDPPCP